MKRESSSILYSYTHIFVALFIALILSGCDNTEQDMLIENDSILAKYESFNLETYRATIENEIEAANEEYNRLTNRLKIISKSSSKTPKSKKVKINVPDDYSTIQEAVNAAPEGAEIKINGNFTEIVNIIGKNNLTLKGTEGASVEDNEYAFFINISNNIQIKDLRVRGHISIFNSQNIEIKNNDISGSSKGYGVYMLNNTNCTIKDNYIHDLTGDNLDRGGGIYCVFNNDNNEIKGNNITRARLGIELQNGSDNNLIKDNTVSDTRFVGIGLVANCMRNKVYDNSITNAAWVGLSVVFGSNENDIRGVQTTFCNGNPPIWFSPFAVGVGIAESNNNNLYDITTNNNTVGMGLRLNSRHNLISNLNVRNNSLIGMLLEPTADSNIIRESVGVNNGNCDLVNNGANNNFIDSSFNNICY